MSQVVVTARIDAETAAKLDRLGAEHDRKRSWLIAQAIKRYAEQECAFFEFVREGEDSAERDGTVSHEEVMAEYADFLEQRKSAA